jgi:hypothetical protein
MPLGVGVAKEEHERIFCSSRKNFHFVDFALLQSEADSQNIGTP